MAYVDPRNRAPSVEYLPDARSRVTRLFDVLNFVTKDPQKLIDEVWLPWGTQDDDFPLCRLIRQDVTGQNSGAIAAPTETPPKLVRVYETIPQNDRIQVGNPNVSFDQYGNKTTVLEFLQFSAGSTVYTDVVGTTAAPAPNADCILKTLERPNDGTLIRWKLNYISSGELSDVQNLRFGGKVVLRDITSLGTEPVTPSGWSRVTTSIEFTQGRKVFRYGFVNSGGGGGGAGGEISRTIQYNESPDQGATGVTVTTIKQVSDLTVISNPITGPIGSQLISVSYEDDTGLRMWTAIYASGVGVVSTSVQTKELGKLIIYSTTSINAVPSTPAPTIGGTVRLTSAVQRNGSGGEDGVVIYDYSWAEGEGVVSQTVESKNEGKLILYRTRALGTAPSTPAPTIGGTVTLIEQTTINEDGYTAYDYQWAEGNGIITTETEIKNGGKLILYHIVALGVAPSAPAPTIGGTVTLIDSDVREQDGYELFDYRWAEGNGQISRETEYRQSVNTGTTGLTVITIRYLSNLATASNPISTPSGTILITEGSVNQDGYQIWTATYAKGTGTVSTIVHGREDFSLVYEVTSLSAAASTPAYPGSGTAYLTSLENELSSGHYINRAVYIKPPPSTAFRKQRTFLMPGLAYFVGTDLILQPATELTLLATETVSFGTAQDTTTPYTVTRWAGFIETYVPTDTGVAINNQYGLNGYLAAGATVFGSGTYKGVPCTSYTATRFASNPTSLPTGATTIGVMNEPYLIATDGTVVFRSTVTTVTLP